jgi:hypothetical protein
MNANRNGSALAMTAPELSVSMKTAIEQAERAIAEQEQIEQALMAAREGLQAAEKERREAQGRLAVAESGAAVGGGDVDRAARKRLVAARDECEFGQARVAGLEDRLRTATAATTAAQRALAVETRNWKRDQAGAIVEQVLLPEINATLDALRTVAAVGTALGSQRLLAISRQAFLCEPGDPSRNLASRQRLAWQQHPESATTYERLSALMAEIRPLLGEFADRPIHQTEPDDGVAA